jgi:hypothetical protein
MERRKRRLKGVSKRQSRPYPKILTLLVLVIILVTVFVYSKLSDLESYTYVTKGEDGAAILRRVDTNAGKIYEVVFSADTEMDLAYNLGTYKISNTWILGDKEGYRGDLIAKSILKNYAFPVYLWDNGYTNNLNLPQRIKNVLINKKLARMEKDQYVVDDTTIPYYVYLNFSLPSLRENIAKIEVEDGSNEAGMLPVISSVVEVIGGKIINNAKVKVFDYDCKISGSNASVVEELAAVFSCKKEIDPKLQSDAKIIFGTKFTGRF